jgi:rRNA-processing protein FCF1
MIGSIAMNEIKSYLNIEKVDVDIQDEVLTWYVRHNKLFLKTNDQKLKIQIFKNKLDIVLRINQKLSEIWYNVKIQEIMFK